MGGDIPANHLLTYLEKSIKSADSIDIIVSFLMESGVRLLLPALKNALDRGAAIRLLTGNYLGITQPSALALLKYELEDRVCVHLYQEKNRSFHPKAYIFHYADNSEIYVGSSNISRSALTKGIEWNYRFSEKDDEQSYHLFFEEFEDLFYNHSVEVTDKVLKDYFDYIVIDEFHHAVNDGYRKIIRYFQYRFLLGLTATPNRMDGRNIYEICDYNVPFEITLKDAINKGMLVPFHYYGIYDGVDYSGLPVVRGKYLQKDLDIKLIVKERCDLIYKNYRKYGSQRALGFCCSRAHAERMAEEFCARNVPACAVYSDADGNFSEDRTAAIEKLEKGELKVIFSVDMFNEGVDIPSLDMVMFLRPTESPVVFLQQLGRGLRKEAGKEYLTVLDFMGNYEKAGNAPFLLSGEPYSREAAERKEQKDFDFPLDCVVDFDMRLIDLFKEMAARKETKKERIRGEYFRIKEFLGGKVPARMDLFTYMEEEIYQLCLKNSKENPFNHYLDFLKELKELTDDERRLSQGPGWEFLHIVETTSMSKSYKMPILLAFYNDGEIKMGITEEDVYQSCKAFYEKDQNWRDMEKDKNTRDFRSWDKKRYVSEARKNPVHFLKESGSGFFVDREGFVLALRDDLKDVVTEPAFVQHMKDIIDYRTMNYYRQRYEKGEQG